MAPWTARLASGTSQSTRDEMNSREGRSNLPPHIRSGQGIYVPVMTSAAALPSTPSPPRSRQPHSRSISHPVPSSSSPRKSPGSKNELHLLQDDIVDEDRNHAQASGLSRSLSPHKQSRGPTQPEAPSTCRCMTCDHTSSFPRGRKGFRCGKCATMNDLEPFDESSALRVPESAFGDQPKPRNEGTVSLERTRAIIDQCLTSYLRRQLEASNNGDIFSSGHAHPSPERGGSDGRYCGEDYHLDKYELTPTSGATGIKSPEDVGGHTHASKSMLYPSDGAENTKSGLRQGYETLSHQRQGSSDHHLSPNTGPLRRTPDDKAFDYVSSRSAAVFGSLERYIMAHFDGCDALNKSFLTGRPRYPRTASDGAQQVFSQEETSQPATCYVPSQLDESPIRLGDIAENDPRWTADRPSRHKSTDDGTQTSTAETRANSVSLKSPRINWHALAEWYKLILNAGEWWLEKWKRMRPAETEDPTLVRIWDQTDLSALSQQIHQSRLHLRTTLLRATERLLQRPKRPLRRPGETRFILILLENPLLYPSSGYSTDTTSASLTVSHPSGRSKSDDGPVPNESKVRPPARSHSSAVPMSDRTDYRTHIIKRAVGLLAHLPSECHRLFLSWFSRFSDSHFRQLVELVSTFVSHRLVRQQKRRPKKHVNPRNNNDANIDEFVPTFSASGHTTSAQLHTALNRDKSSRTPNSEEGYPNYGDDWQIKAAARVMALLFRANYSNHNQRVDPAFSGGGSQTLAVSPGYGVRIPISTFYSTLLDYYDLVADFEAWESRSGCFTFCQYSFFLSIWAKIRILEHDARRQMEAKAREAFFDTILGRGGVSQYLVLKVRRDCLVEDSMRGVSEVVGSAQEEIKKGLRIEFNGEEGVDAGGIRKEWFLLLTREIFDPNHGLFLYDEDSQFCYFNPYCFESSEQFFLVGVLLGLAIYNSTILDIALPAFAFRKLLASTPSNSSVPALSTPSQSFRCTLEDLAEYRPALARGLRQLLEYEGDVEETFCQSFVAHQERYGEAVEVPLCPGGQNRPVTNHNRREFVDLYVKYVLNDAVSRQFEPFKRGFFTVCGGNALCLFRPEEIELLVRGSDEPLDIPSLRAVATYEHWPVTYPDKEPVVQWFWAFFTRINPKDQRKLLSFITGSDRVPAMGATNLTIRLVYLGQDSERFPTARTCFNMVALYRYDTREKLEAKLWRAVAESEGFGLK